MGDAPLVKCATCGAWSSKDELNCQHCGARLGALAVAAPPGMLVGRPCRPLLAGILSLFVPGLGQIYVGQVGKGFLFLVFMIGGFFTAGLSHLILAVYAAAEAFKLARMRNNGEAVTAWGTLWDPTWGPRSK